MVKPVALILAIALAASGCASSIIGTTATSELPTGAPSPGPNDCFPLAPLELEKRLTEGDVEVRSSKSAGAGVTGASKLTVHLEGLDREFTVKWKTAPQGYDGWNNSPRKEIASYEVQKLFLDQQDFVVPPALMRCFELNEAKQIYPTASSNVADGECTLGMLTAWIEHVKPIKNPLIEARFRDDATYAYHVSNFNVLTYLVDHRDGRFGNFFLAEGEREGRVFAIDNGISFDPWIYNYFVANWNRLRVAAISKRTLERLRQITPEACAKLGVLAELRRGTDGIYRNTSAGPNLDPEKGVRVAKGIVQLGLTADEIANLRQRLSDLLRAVDQGRLKTF